MKLKLALALALATTAAVCGAASDSFITVQKSRLCKECAPPALPVPLPRHGMILARGSIFSKHAAWYIVDFESAEATRLITRLDETTQKSGIGEQQRHALSPGELIEITRLANRIWASESIVPSHYATDVVWDLWLIDGDDIRRDMGSGLPDGPAREFEDLLQRYVTGK